MQGTSGNVTDQENVMQPPKIDPTGGVNDVVRALMAGYLRKQRSPGGGPPFTSVAPPGVLNTLKGFDKNYSFGVPYTGLQYDTDPSASLNPYAAIFGQAP